MHRNATATVNRFSSSYSGTSARSQLRRISIVSQTTPAGIAARCNPAAVSRTAASIVASSRGVVAAYRIQQFVRTQIGTDPGALADRPECTLSARSGTASAKAVLTASLLAAAGIETELCVGRTNGQLVAWPRITVEPYTPAQVIVVAGRWDAPYFRSFIPDGRMSLHVLGAFPGDLSHSPLFLILSGSIPRFIGGEFQTFPVRTIR